MKKVIIPAAIVLFSCKSITPIANVKIESVVRNGKKWELVAITDGGMTVRKTYDTYPPKKLMIGKDKYGNCYLIKAK